MKTKRCTLCGGSGIRFTKGVQPDPEGGFTLCSCVTKTCTCGGASPYQVFTPEGDPSWCVCRAARTRLIQTRRIFKDCGVPRKYAFTFMDDFERTAPSAGKFLGIVDTIREKKGADRWDKGFYLWGPTGSGKTLLACIILHELMMKYTQAGMFIDLSRQFFNRLKRSFDTSDESYGSSGRILEELIRVPFLVIDDFGVQRNTEWESEMLYNLIDSRYSEERITIVTSNSAIGDYKDVSLGRVYSRIIEMCRIVNVDLPDYREKMSQYL